MLTALRNGLYLKSGILGTVLILLQPHGGWAQHASPSDAYRQRSMSFSPELERAFPEQLLFGDTHLHTAYSYDAGMIGNVLDAPRAYQFARGDTVVASLGVPARLRTPLDFLAVTDHAESLGLAPALVEQHPLILEDANAVAMRDLIAEGNIVDAFKTFAQLRARGVYVLHREDMIQPMWQRLTAAAEAYNDPGRFTTLIGYEYTSGPQQNNLHRVVLFRDDAEQANRVLPFSSVESTDPEDLWRWMADYESATGGGILAIPHNGNLSNGLMFGDYRLNGEAPDADYARRRAHWEPLYEMTQIKGDSETHPFLSPEDEFADFWRWDRGNFGFAAKTPEMLASEYARSALLQGLEYEATLGVNPYQFGLIGSTDSHTGLATAEENNFFSKATPGEPGVGVGRYLQDIVQKFRGKDDVSIPSYRSAAGGLVAVWAHENTRESIFDALRRREVYATTGPHIGLRVFAGFSFPENSHQHPDLAAIGYRHGLPMGSVLGPADGAPLQLLISAERDPLGAALDRVQVVKGWQDSAGKTHEKVFDVAFAGSRALDERGHVAAIASTVNGAHYNNSVGAAVLSTLWQDPHFDAGERAFYYVRVLEVPTPTWLAYDRAFYGDLVDLPDDAQWVHQERAYSSPIWYSP